MSTAAIPHAEARRLWTFNEMAAQIPESNAPTELWDGEIVMSPAPNPNHQEIVFNFATRLWNFVKANGLGKVFLSPLDVVLSERRAVQPDVIHVSSARLAIVQDVIQGAPDLVAEVISTGSWKRDRLEKKDLYEQFGVAEYWIIDPEARTVEVFVLEQGAYHLHSRAEPGQTAVSKALPGFEVNWDQLRA